MCHHLQFTWQIVPQSRYYSSFQQCTTKPGCCSGETLCNYFDLQIISKEKSARLEGFNMQHNIFIQLCFRGKFEKKPLLLICTGNGSRKKYKKVKFCETTTLLARPLPSFLRFFMIPFLYFEGYAISLHT